MTADDPTAQLCRFLTTTAYDDIPTDVRTHAKRMIMDTLGVTLIGADTPPAAIIQSTTGDDGASRIPGTALTRSPATAARVTGTMAHALDFDDVHHRMGGHPSSPVLAALLPIAERHSASGEAFLRAFVLGTEAELFLADVLNPGHYERGWHPTSVLGTVGAAAAVGALLKLDQGALQRALGIAASMAAGTKENFGTMTKPLHVGNAARAGLEAGELAGAGFTASNQVLEASFGGFCDLYQGNPGYDFDDHVDRLGDSWGLLDPPVGFKPYPCCGSTHSAIDAALALQDGHDLALDSIESVHIEAHPRRLGHTDKPEPTTTLAGKFSIQYCVTVALDERTVWLDQFDDDVVTSDRYQTFLDRVTASPAREDFEHREWGARVTVETAHGSEIVTVDAPRGSAENPLSQRELEQKYRRCAASTLDEDQIEHSLSTLDELETVPDLTALLVDLTPT